MADPYSHPDFPGRRVFVRAGGSLAGAGCGTEGRAAARSSQRGGDETRPWRRIRRVSANPAPAIHPPVPPSESRYRPECLNPAKRGNLRGTTPGGAPARGADTEA